MLFMLAVVLAIVVGRNFLLKKKRKHLKSRYLPQSIKPDHLSLSFLEGGRWSGLHLTACDKHSGPLPSVLQVTAPGDGGGLGVGAGVLICVM